MSEAAERYARALLDLSEAKGCTGPLKEALGRLVAALETSRELREALMNPLVDHLAKIRVVNEITGGRDELLASLLGLLDEKGRLGELSAVGRSYLRWADEREGILEARLESAVPLDEKEREEIRTLLERRFQKKIRLVERSSPELLGGLRVVLRDEVLDLSLATQLRQIGQRMRYQGARKAGGAS